MIKVSVETVDAVKRRLTVEVPEGQVLAEAKRLFDELAQKAHVKGFRQGRVPRAVIERLFGDRVRADVISKLIGDSYQEALREQKIEPVAQPEIVTEQAELGSSLRYSATVEVKPTIIAHDYKGIETERVLTAVTDI